MANSVEEKFKRELSDLGRVTLNTLFPKDIEYYALSLELCDSMGRVVDFFSWPILPEQIYDTHKEITNVGRTFGGVNVLLNQTFQPRSLFIKGTFGQRFKILVNGQSFEFAGIHLGLKQGKFDISGPKLDTVIPQFSSFAKTGYGCIKVLEAMKEKSKKLDDFGKPFSLYLYNPILGNNYQVVIDSFVHGQDNQQNNMIPYYILQITAIAPLDSVFSRLKNIRSSIKNVTFSKLQKKASSLAAPITKALDSLI